MNADDRNFERYSHCLCLHVKTASLFIGVLNFIGSILAIILIMVSYNLTSNSANDELMKKGSISIIQNRFATTSLTVMFYVMIALVSAMLLYGVTKSRPSYLMPFFGMQLYNFFFSLPSSFSSFFLTSHYWNQNRVSNSNSGIRRFFHSSDLATVYTSSVLFALIDFFCYAYFICAVWKCYRYLKMKELIIPLHLPYNLRGVEQIVVPSETTAPPVSVSPPDYETVTKSCPPPDYYLAIKYQNDLPPDFNSLSNTTVVQTPTPKSESNNQSTSNPSNAPNSTNQANQTNQE